MSLIEKVYELMLAVIKKFFELVKHYAWHFSPRVTSCFIFLAKV